MHTPDIPRIRRTSNANFQGGGKNIIETYHFSLPSLEMFVRDKKINRRCKQHDKDMKVLRDKHDKVCYCLNSYLTVQSPNIVQ